MENKQIEEMAKMIYLSCDIPLDFSKLIALKIYKTGYRKASEVAREIFEEIDRMIYKVLNDRHYIMGDMCYEVAELKKKYTENENNDR